MQVLDRAGVGTLWSICKTKFALAGHTHSSVTDGTMTIYPMANNEVNFGGSNNSATIYFGYRAKDSKPIPTSFVFGGSTGTATLTAAKFKGALEGNASTASNASKVNGHTVNSDVPSGAKFTDTNTWRGIQDNLTSTSTSESLSANQGKVLKGLVDGKANSSHTHTLGQITNAGNAAGKNVRTLNSVSHSSWSSASTDDLYVPTMSFIAYWNGAYNSSGNSNLQYCSRGKFGALAVKDTADWSQVANKPTTATRWPSWGEITSKPELKNWSETKSYIDSKVSSANSGSLSMLTIQGYLQNQLNSFGLKIGAISTCYTNKINNPKGLGKYIYNPENYFFFDANNKAVFKYNASINKFFYKYNITLNASSQTISISFVNIETGKTEKNISITGNYPMLKITPNYTYIVYGENQNTLLDSLNVVIVGRDLSLKTVTYSGQSYYNSSGSYSLDLGDDGVIIGYDNYASDSSTNFIVYKNGTFYKKSKAGKFYYVKNGHNYEIDKQTEFITDSFSVTTPNITNAPNYTYKNQEMHIVIYVLNDLVNNRHYYISLPISIFNVQGVNSIYTELGYFTQSCTAYCIHNTYGTDNIGWYTRIYKE